MPPGTPQGFDAPPPPEPPFDPVTVGVGLPDGPPPPPPPPAAVMVENTELLPFCPFFCASGKDTQPPAPPPPTVIGKDVAVTVIL